MQLLLLLLLVCCCRLALCKQALLWAQRLLLLLLLLLLQLHHLLLPPTQVASDACPSVLIGGVGCVCVLLGASFQICNTSSWVGGFCVVVVFLFVVQALIPSKTTETRAPLFLCGCSFAVFAAGTTTAFGR